MLHPKTYSTEYGRVREKLIPSKRQHVTLVEDEIVEDPEARRTGRYEVDGYYHDTKVPMVIIKYRLLDGGWVSFDELMDLSNPDL